jgi:hypothetical protein
MSTPHLYNLYPLKYVFTVYKYTGFSFYFLRLSSIFTSETAILGVKQICTVNLPAVHYPLKSTRGEAVDPTSRNLLIVVLSLISYGPSQTSRFI